MSVKDNEVAARRFLVDVWSKGNMGAVDELVSPDFAFILSFMATHGTDAFKELVRRNRAAFRDLTYTVEDIVAGEDKAAAYWKMNSTHVGVWRNIAPTNKQVAIEGMTFFKFSDGQIVEAKVQNDVLGLMQQLDAVSIKATAAAKNN
jgi:steroid delta-isomerase-like uncharacterized protein